MNEALFAIFREKQEKQKNRKWTQEEDQYIIDNASITTVDVLANKLNRTQYAIANRVQYLRDDGHHVYLKRRPRIPEWTAQEDGYIKCNRHRMSIKRIADGLGRSYASTYRRAVLLKKG